MTLKPCNHVKESLHASSIKASIKGLGKAIIILHAFELPLGVVKGRRHASRHVSCLKRSWKVRGACGT